MIRIVLGLLVLLGAIVGVYLGAIGGRTLPDVPVSGTSTPATATRVGPATPANRLATPRSSPAASSDPHCLDGMTGVDSTIAGRTIILDPGHGGEDFGTVNDDVGLRESDIVSTIAILLRDLLVADGARVCLTRVTDLNLSLAERASFANERAGQAFVSIHLNHLADISVDYTMTMWGTSTKDRVFAETILSALSLELSTPADYRGVANPIKEDSTLLERLDSSMLRNADMPAVLVEAVFLSNPWEARAFNDGIRDGTHWREQQIARAIHRGLIRFFSSESPEDRGSSLRAVDRLASFE